MPVISKEQIEQVLNFVQPQQMGSLAGTYRTNESIRKDNEAVAIRDMLTSLLTESNPSHVATVNSWTQGSHWRNYKLVWYKDVPEGTELFDRPLKKLTIDDITDEMHVAWNIATRGSDELIGNRDRLLILTAINTFIDLGLKQ